MPVQPEENDDDVDRIDEDVEQIEDHSEPGRKTWRAHEIIQITTRMEYVQPAVVDYAKYEWYEMQGMVPLQSNTPGS